jgi:predicted phage terminase large subunit-like protein
MTKLLDTSGDSLPRDCHSDPLGSIAGLDRLLAEDERRRCTASLYDFFVSGWHVLEATTPLAEGRHLRVLCDHVQAVIEDWAARQRDHGHVQRMRDLIATLPPGTLKSRVLVYALPWAWIRWPEMRVIALSCNPRVATRDSTYTRDVIASDWYRETFRPEWSIRRDTDGKHAFANTAGGFRLAHGLDARIIGQRADALFIDDPHDPEEALSDAQRESVIERWQTSASNRVNDLGSSVRIMIAQRTHEADLPAVVIAEGWTHVDLPLLFELDEVGESPLGRYDWRQHEGECLHPQRFTPEVIEAERQRLGPARFSALYQQRPTPAGGAIIKLSELRFWMLPGAIVPPLPRGCHPELVEIPHDRGRLDLDGVVIAADLAGGRATKTGDFNVVVALGRKGPHFYVLEVYRERADFPDVADAMRGMARRYPGAPIYVEQAAAGGAMIATLSDPRDGLPGVVAVPAVGSKEQRVHATHHFFRAHNVHLPADWSWRDGAVAELTTFPRARHDDFVDALTLALAHGALCLDPAAAEQRRARAAFGAAFGRDRAARQRAFVSEYGKPPAREEKLGLADRMAVGLGLKYGAPPLRRRR